MANNYNLSEGALQIIMKGGEVDQPIMQVLGSKKINSGNSDKERFRILLSDSKNTISFAMLTTQINDTLGQSGLEKFSIIKVKKYITSVINNTGKGDARVLLILDLAVLHHGDDVGRIIGTPTPLNDKGDDSRTKAADDATVSSTIEGNPARPTSNGTSAFVPNYSNPSNHSNISNQLTHPISSLSPYHNRWVIKARVMNKSAIRTWSNSRGEGKLFSMDLADESGEIRCTAFRELVDKFYDYIQVDKVYYISKCQLKPANKQFCTLKNDYEMTMTSETTIQECEDGDTTIPQTKYDFVSIDKIAHMEVGTLIDRNNLPDVEHYILSSNGNWMCGSHLSSKRARRHSIGGDAPISSGCDAPVRFTASGWRGSSNKPLKESHFSKIMGAISSLASDVASIKSSQDKIKKDLEKCFVSIESHQSSLNEDSSLPDAIDDEN